MMQMLNLFTPGRLCLFGEHSDWAGQMRKFNASIVPGQALVACTEEGIYARVARSEGLKLRTVMADGSILSMECPFNDDELRRIAGEGGYFSYVAGVAAYIATYYDIGGIELDCYKMTLPLKKGLSSSAAICVLTARAFNQLYGLNLTVRGEMEVAYFGEQLTPSRCGRLDQVCAYGSGIMHMTFDGDNLDVTPVRVGAPLHLVFADLNAHKDTIAILRNLNMAYPYPQAEAHLGLHHLLGAENAKIIANVVDALGAGDGAQVGQLMQSAQSAFDAKAMPLSPLELEAVVLHRVLHDENLAQWVYGGKGVGSQGDGSVQFVAKDAHCQQALKDYLENILGLDAYTLTIPKTKVVRKAIIPVAGYGTRMYPATTVMKKEFFPVIDADGLAKPVLVIILNELVKAGIEEICLVIKPGDESLYLSLFNKIIDNRSEKRKDTLKSYEKELSVLRKYIAFVHQNAILGFGHAVMQTEKFAANEPVLLLSGDHLFHSHGPKNCVSQLISAHEQGDDLTIGLFDGKPLMYILTPTFYKLLAQENENKFENALNLLEREHGACRIEINGTQYDVGSPEAYRETVAHFGRWGQEK